jgi:hypothetical protein
MRPLLILTLTLALFVGSTCSAAIITFTGDDPNVVDWRNPSVAKPLDTDGDNIYGTDGYVMFAAVQGSVTTSFGPSNVPNPFTFSGTGTNGVTPVQTLVQMPVYVTSFTPLTAGPGFFTSVVTSDTSPSGGFTRIDNPLAPGQLMQSGLAHTTSEASGSHDLFTFTVGGNVPSRFLVGLFFNNAGIAANNSIGPPNTTDAGITGPTGISISAARRTGLPDALFFEIDGATGATGNDTFTVFALGGGAEIMGITFDTPVPEPATLGGCAAAVLVFLWLGRRSKNPKQWRPV